VAALVDGIAALDPDSGRLEMLVPFDSDGGRIRSNDGKCDPAGRLWVGRMALDETPGAGSLLRVDTDRSVSTHLTGLAIPNGLGWSPDGRTMYFIDSTWHEVRAYPYGRRPARWARAGSWSAFPMTGACPTA
jgi:sugar lactone lactonase YvrE